MELSRSKDIGRDDNDKKIDKFTMSGDSFMSGLSVYSNEVLVQTVSEDMANESVAPSFSDFKTIYK